MEFSIRTEKHSRRRMFVQGRLLNDEDLRNHILIHWAIDLLKKYCEDKGEEVSYCE